MKAPKRHTFITCMLHRILIIRVIKSRRMRWAGNVACTGEMRNTHSILVSKLERNRQASRPGQFIPRERVPRYPLDWRLCESQSGSGRGGEERKSLPTPGIETRSSSL